MDDQAKDNTASKYDDHRRPMLRALKLGGLGLVGVSLVSIALWSLLRGMPGFWAVLLGAAIGGGFVLLTAISVLASSNLSPASTGAVVLGSWLVKIACLMFILHLLKDQTFYDKTAFVVTLLVALLVTLGSEVWGVVSSKATYVSE